MRGSVRVRSGYLSVLLEEDAQCPRHTHTHFAFLPLHNFILKQGFFSFYYYNSSSELTVQATNNNPRHSITSSADARNKYKQKKQTSVEKFLKQYLQIKTNKQPNKQTKTNRSPGSIYKYTDSSVYLLNDSFSSRATRKTKKIKKACSHFYFCDHGLLYKGKRRSFLKHQEL